jgi:hypothetical protein
MRLHVMTPRITSSTTSHIAKETNGYNMMCRIFNFLSSLNFFCNQHMMVIWWFPLLPQWVAAVRILLQLKASWVRICKAPAVAQFLSNLLLGYMAPLYGVQTIQPCITYHQESRTYTHFCTWPTYQESTVQQIFVISFRSANVLKLTWSMVSMIVCFNI